MAENNVGVIAILFDRCYYDRDILRMNVSSVFINENKTIIFLLKQESSVVRMSFRRVRYSILPLDVRTIII